MLGFVDYDLQTSTSASLRPPNLEIMKLSTYYRTEENTFCRLIDLNETELSSYDKIFFFSESDETITIPEAFLRMNNIVYGGTGFTKGKYTPFENEVIDYTLPRPTIYKDYLKNKYNDGIKAKVIEHMLDDTYYRCWAGENKLPIPAILPQHRIYLYDREFFYDDWEDTINEISERKPSSIICIHPIICHTVTDYFKLREKPKIARTNTILLEFNIPLKEVDYMLNKYGKYFLADISEHSNVVLTLGGDFLTRIQYYNDMIYKLNLLYAFWARSIPIKIKYIQPHIGYNDPLHELSSVIATWTANKKNTQTINNRIVLKSKKQKSIAHEERDQLLRMFPRAADLFDQNYNIISQRRLWRL